MAGSMLARCLARQRHTPIFPTSDKLKSSFFEPDSLWLTALWPMMESGASALGLPPVVPQLAGSHGMSYLLDFKDEEDRNVIHSAQA